MWSLAKMHRAVYWGIIAGCVVVALYFLLWFIQTAWLGSFPDRDKELYGQWAMSQLAVAVLAVIIAVAVGIAGPRTTKKSYPPLASR